MEGYVVMLLQYALHRAGMDVGNPDGIFGRRTVKALQRFQREQGMTADGIAGKLTWAALFPYMTGYIPHRVAPGDTFFRLAERYVTSITAIQTANPSMDGRKPLVGEMLVIPLSMPVVTAHMPSSSFLTQMMVKGLSMRYPFLVVHEIGRSVMGQRILALSMGSGKRHVGCIAAHHANEWLTTLVLLRFLEEYAAAYASGGSMDGLSAKTLYDTATLHLIPLVNPDGVDLVAGALDPADSFYTQAAALAAHYPDIPFPDRWQSNISGVDLELQYPTEWAANRRAKVKAGFARPGPQAYAGTGPLIAPESRAIAEWIRKHDFDSILSFDGGCTAWFQKTWRRSGITVAIGKDPLPLSRFEDFYKQTLPLLVRGITFFP